MIHLTLFAATDMIPNVYFLKINKFQGKLCDHKGFSDCNFGGSDVHIEIYL